MSFKDLVLDYSKNRVTVETMQLLFALAKDAGMRLRLYMLCRAGLLQEPSMCRDYAASFRSRGGCRYASP